MFRGARARPLKPVPQNFSRFKFNNLHKFQTRSYNYNHFQQLAARPSRFKRFIVLNFWIVSCTAFAYYMWWPKHTFPSPVAAILRKALWAESDKGENDYELALKHYLEALEECQTVGVDPLSDEYTGIQLKVAEMYERLGMMDDAAFTYNEIATMYLSVLKAAPKSEQGLRIRGIDHRAHLIQKDLRVALKLVELNRPNPSLCKAILITHLLIAQDEVNRKLGLSPAGGASLMAPETSSLGQFPNSGLSKAQLLEKYADDDAVTQQIQSHESGDILVIESNPDAWEPFKDEFFTALDVLSTICVSVGDIKAASSVRVAMTNKMLLAGVAPDKLLLSQCNTASLLYFQAEQLQAEEQNWRKKFSEVAGVDHDKVKALHDHLRPETVTQEEAETIKKQISDAVSLEDKAAYEDTVQKRKQMVDMVIATYDSVIQGSKTLPPDVVRDNVSVGETVALATYGLGVVNLHLARYDKAERLLREARVRSKACGYDALIEEVERELGKLFNERNMIKNRDGGIEMDVHLAKTKEQG